MAPYIKQSAQLSKYEKVLTHLTSFPMIIDVKECKYIKKIMKNFSLLVLILMTDMSMLR